MRRGDMKRLEVPFSPTDDRRTTEQFYDGLDLAWWARLGPRPRGDGGRALLRLVQRRIREGTAGVSW